MIASQTLIDELGLLRPGWNGPRSIGPSARIIKNAKLLLVQLDHLNPSLSIEPTGEISFYWHNIHYSIDIDIEAGGYSVFTFSYGDGRASHRTYDINDLSGLESLPVKYL